MQRAKQILSFIFIVYVLFISCSDKNPDLISKNLEARGGVDAFNNIISQKITGKVSIRQEPEIPFTLFLKRPNFIRLESEYQSKQLVSATDGQKIWWINPMKSVHSATEMPEIEATRLLDLQFLYWGYLQTTKKMGYDIQFQGKESIAEQEFYILKLKKDEDVQNLYLDSGSFLERRIVGKLKGFGLNAETVFSDYRKVEEILMPYKIEFIVNGNKDVITIIDNIELNVKMDDSIFKMPLTIFGDLFK